MQITKKWREITLVAVIIGIIILLSLLIKHLFAIQDQTILELNEIKTNWEKIASGETSEEKLKENLEKAKDEYDGIDGYLPKGLKKQEVNLAITDISNNVNVKGFSIDNATLSDEKAPNKAQYEAIRVNMKNITGTYQEVKELLEYINNYNQKISVTTATFDKSDDTNELKGSMTLIFYGEANG